jgi:hypothetical protein
MNPETDEKDNKWWRNSNGDYHRDDGPAIEWFDGDKAWYQNGKLHREDGPALHHHDGNKYWFLNDKRIR